MAEEQANRPQDEGSAAGSPEVSAELDIPRKKTGGFLKRLFSPQVLVVLIVALLLVQGGGLALHTIKVQADANNTYEISLGPFSFAPNPAERSWLDSARFSLYVVPIPQEDEKVRELLEKHKFRVQQDLEELFRQAHGGDFADPTLGELKRRIREQINQTLDMKAIADVIITDVDLVRSSRDAKPSSDNSDGAPWGEPAK
ncbi:MAG: hypothetical protein JW818_21535 [Pirellulales bacterium]|nr:hypothetical protein [Pirellulales bacterium]